jgi:dolichol kinase
MARQGGHSLGGSIATILIAIIVIWLVLKLLGVALKLVGLLILVGVAAALFFAVRGRIGGPRA